MSKRRWALGIGHWAKRSLFFALLFAVTFVGKAGADGGSQFGNAYQSLTKKNAIGAVNTLKQRVASGDATPGEWELYAIAMWNGFGDDSLGAAIRAATAAYRYAPTKENKELLDWLQYKITNKIEGIPEIALFKVTRNILLSITVEWLTGLMMAGVMIAFGWWLFSARIPFIRTTLNVLPTIGIAVFVIGLGLSVWRYQWVTSPAAFVTQTGVSVFQKPDFSSKEIASVSTGTEVKPLSTFGRWQEVRLADGRTGWIQSSVLDYLVLD